MEGIIGRYLTTFLPFLAVVVLAHLILRSGSSWQLERAGLGWLTSPVLLRRVLVATGVAIAIIVGVDGATGGDLFLRPSPRSLLLIGAVVAGLVVVDRLRPLLRRSPAALPRR